MSNYFESIPPAVATIVSSYCTLLGKPRESDGADELDKRLSALTDKLTRTFAKALADASAGKP